MTTQGDIRNVLAKYAKAELARRSLLDFARYAMPAYQTPRHVRFLAAELDEMVRPSGAGAKKSIALPIRHGKSVLCSQLLPPFILGRNPRANIVIASHSEGLAVMHSRIARNIVGDRDRYPFDVELSADSTSVARWNVKEGGGCYAVGVGGALTGRGADWLIVDDALHDGLSATEREAAWNWLREVALPRQEPGCRVLIVNARMASDDLTGRLAESDDRSEWTFISLPGIAGPNDPLGRAEGEALWPERISRETLLQRRVELGERAWSSQVQQDPHDSSSGLIRREWLERARYRELPKWRADTNPASPFATRPGYGVPTLNPTVTLLSCDPAMSLSTQADYTAICALVLDPRSGNAYVSGFWRGRCGFQGLLDALAMMADRHQPNAGVYVEHSSVSEGWLQYALSASRLPIVGITPGGRDKYARLATVAPMFEAGKVQWPADPTPPWVEVVWDELCRFTGEPSSSARHDDCVDALELGLRVGSNIISQRNAHHQARRVAEAMAQRRGAINY